MNADVTLPRLQSSMTSRLTMLLAWSCGFVLLLSCVGFIVTDISLLRRSRIDELSSVAHVLASDSAAALAFIQPVSATERLSLLHERHEVECAYLFDGEGKVFASFHADEAKSPIPEYPTTMGHSFSMAGVLTVSVPVVEANEQIGVLLLRGPVRGIRSQIYRYLAVATCVALSSLLLAALVGSRLQRSISDPLGRLAAAMDRVSDGDYSIRVEPRANDEIGELYDAFNRLMSRLEAAQATPQRSTGTLQKVGARRTKVS